MKFNYLKSFKIIQEMNTNNSSKTFNEIEIILKIFFE